MMLAHKKYKMKFLPGDEIMQNRSDNETTPLDKLKSMCASLNWEACKSFLGSDTIDLAQKIFVSAFIQAKHPDEKYRDEYGMAGCWDEHLSNIPVKFLSRMYTGRVWLADFYVSFCIAGVVLDGGTIDPKLVQDIIRNYVVENKINLAGVLSSHRSTF